VDYFSNFRDVGGCPVAGGGVIRTGVLYRSASLAGVRDDALAHLGELGIRTVIDLRRPSEVTKFGRVADAVGRRYVNIAPEHALWEDEPPYDEVAGVARYLADRYATLARDGATQYAEALRLMAAPEGTPTVVHCFAGKDRTGVLIAVTLALLGVADEAIAADYALSDAWSRAHSTLDIPAHFLPAPPEAILTFLADLRSAYGDVYNYAASAGLRDTDLAALRTALVSV
jgi:protein-tyrosine phosphatase